MKRDKNMRERQKAFNKENPKVGYLLMIACVDLKYSLIPQIELVKQVQFMIKICLFTVPKM